jgi:hypothetical protein
MNPPQGIDLKYSSFNKKANFTSLKNSNKFNKKNNGNRYVPGGDWAEDNDSPSQNNDFNFGSENTFTKPNETKAETNILSLNDEIDFGYIEKQKQEESVQSEQIQTAQPVPKKEKNSKFGFIKKKKNGTSSSNSAPVKTLLIPSVQLSEEKYKYPKKIVQDIVEPIGARKKPSDAVLQNFIKQTSNFDPRIILSILFHLLKDPLTVWLSKYRGLVALEVLLKRNNDYLNKAKELGEIFKNGVFDTCSNEEFTQKSHEQLIVKMKTSVVGLLSVDNAEEDLGSKKTFDFNKMNQMIQHSSKPKKQTNAGFMQQMNDIKKKNKKNKNENENKQLQNEFDLLDLSVPQTNQAESSNNNNTQSNTNDMFSELDFVNPGSVANNTAMNTVNNTNNTQANNLLDLDFGDSSNTNNTMSSSQNNTSNSQPSAVNYDDLDFL